MSLELKGDSRSEDDILGIARAELTFKASRLRPPWELVETEKRPRMCLAVPRHEQVREEERAEEPPRELGAETPVRSKGRRVAHPCHPTAAQWGDTDVHHVLVRPPTACHPKYHFRLCWSLPRLFLYSTHPVQ